MYIIYLYIYSHILIVYRRMQCINLYIVYANVYAYLCVDMYIKRERDVHRYNDRQRDPCLEKRSLKQEFEIEFQRNFKIGIEMELKHDKFERSFTIKT